MMDENMMKHIINQTADNIIKDIDINKYSKKSLIFVCGPMGSGKSTYINDKFKNHDAYYCNIDKWVHYFIPYENEPGKLYSLCRKVGIIVTDYLLEQNISMILEGTGINLDTIEYLKRLKNADYKINTYFLVTDIETCRNRVIKRNVNNLHIVDDKDVINAHRILYGQNYLLSPMVKLTVEQSNYVTYIRGT
jgi:predicted ABC-type ATPase